MFLSKLSVILSDKDIPCQYICYLLSAKKTISFVSYSNTNEKIFRVQRADKVILYCFQNSCLDLNSQQKPDSDLKVPQKDFKTSMINADT